MDYILAVDQGTSSTRAMIYTVQGQLLYNKQYPLTQNYPMPGWVEHDPEEIWQKTVSAIREVVAMVDNEKIIACGLTNQRETTVIWDKETGKCLAPAIVWQDRRTQAFCDGLSAKKSLIQTKTGLLPDPYFSASKIHWLFKNVPEAIGLANKGRLAFGTIDTFLIWRLTGGKAHLTDHTNASRTLLYNIHTLAWDDELLGLFSIPSSILPEVCNNDANFGLIDKSLLGREIPITGVAGDQQAALVGQRCFKEGAIKATFGTGGFLLLNTGTKPVTSKHNLTTIAYKTNKCLAYGLEGSLYHAGTIVKWLRDELKIIEQAGDTEILAKSLESNEGVYLIPSFTGLGAPYWSNTQGALVLGLSRSSNRSHFARAALESVCYLTRDVLACMNEDSQLNLSVLRVDGGMAANNWFLQFLASQCNLLVQRPFDIETTAQGAAAIAALGCGVVSSLEDLEKSWGYEREFLPLDENREKDYKGWRKAMEMVLGASTHPPDPHKTRLPA